MDQGLARRRLARAALHHLAHDDLFDRGGVDAGARNGLPDDHRAELRRGKAGQAAEIAPDGRADGGENDGGGAVAHGYRSG